MIPTVGHIPPEFRQVVYANELTQEEIENIKYSTWISENGKYRRHTDEEIKSEFRRIKGVIDTRTGEYIPCRLGIKQVINPNEFLERMLELEKSEDYDPESSHIKGDDLMCEILKDLGYEEGVEVYNRMKKMVLVVEKNND